MRAVLVSFIAAAAFVVSAPVAAAATFDLGAERTLERALVPGADVSFEMPLRVNQDGFLYAKVLPTPGNAVNDGSGPNGSAASGAGWFASFAMLGPGGAREELGAFANSTPSKLYAVARGETPTLVVTLHVPSDAARGGGRQTVYVAIAYRLDAAPTSGGGASGAQLDEARAITLLLTDALLPPPAADDGLDEQPVQDPLDDPTTSPPPVAPVDTDGEQIIVVDVHAAQLPTWFLVGALVLGALAVGILATALAVLLRIRQVLRRREAERPVEVPVRVSAGETATLAPEPRD